MQSSLCTYEDWNVCVSSCFNSPLVLMVKIRLIGLRSITSRWNAEIREVGFNSNGPSGSLTSPWRMERKYSRVARDWPIARADKYKNMGLSSPVVAVIKAAEGCSPDLGEASSLEDECVVLFEIDMEIVSPSSIGLSSGPLAAVFNGVLPLTELLV
uniref:Uncharacterized protein n=1 Tax=Glossina pallidipes TaxID=7398 RepID=A0A1A9Z5J1_GLOPL